MTDIWIIFNLLFIRIKWVGHSLLIPLFSHQVTIQAEMLVVLSKAMWQSSVGGFE